MEASGICSKTAAPRGETEGARGSIGDTDKAAIATSPVTDLILDFFILRPGCCCCHHADGRTRACPASPIRDGDIRWLAAMAAIRGLGGFLEFRSALALHVIGMVETGVNKGFLFRAAAVVLGLSGCNRGTRPALDMVEAV